MLLHDDPALARAEPKKLRYRLLHVAARLVRGGCRLRLKIEHARQPPKPTAHPSPQDQQIGAKIKSVRPPPELPGLEALTRADSCVALVEQPPSFFSR